MEITTKNMRALLINVLLGLAAVAAVFVAIGGGWSIAKYTGILPLKKAKKAVVIDDTPITIENVRAIGELVTANYYDEAVSIIGKVEHVIEKGNSRGKDSTYIQIERVPEPGQTIKGKGRNKQEKPYKGPKLILIQTVHARLGVDLSQLQAESLKVSEADKSVEVRLPELKCVDFITNPSNTEVFQEDGEWSLDELKEAMMPAREEIWDKMMESTKLFDTARKGAEEVITQLFQAAGYRTVKVSFASSGTPVIEMPQVE